MLSCMDTNSVKYAPRYPSVNNPRYGQLDRFSIKSVLQKNLREIGQNLAKHWGVNWENSVCNFVTFIERTFDANKYFDRLYQALQVLINVGYMNVMGSSISRVAYIYMQGI